MLLLRCFTILIGFRFAQAIGVTSLTPRAEVPSHVLHTYPIPSGVDTSTAFDVKVRAQGGPWKKLDLYRPLLAEVNFTTGGTTRHTSSLGYFDFNGNVEVSATYKNGVVNKAAVRPASLGIEPRRSSDAVTFKLTQPSNIFLQINDDVFDGLHLFSNSIETGPSENDPDVIYYGPGLHEISGDVTIPSGQTLYVAGGAVVKANNFVFINATDASIKGHGVLLPNASTGGAISITRSRNITIDGIIGLNVVPRTYEADDVVLSNIRHISSVQWGDGIDVFCSNNVLIDRAFLRTSDDSLAIYNHRGEWYGDVTNVTLQNSALWADLAHPINIGTHGNSENPEKTDGVVIRNVDILDHREGQILFQGCIALNAGDNNLLQNILIEDVRVENFRRGQLFNFRVIKNSYNTGSRQRHTERRRPKPQLYRHKRSNVHHRGL